MKYLETETIELESTRIEMLYLNHEETRNSMTWEMGEEFYNYIQILKNREPRPRCLIISGRNNVFSSGGNLEFLKSFSEKTFEENKRDMFTFYNFFLSVRTLPFPVIAAVNGHAIGAALSLAFACDLRVFALESKYSFNFVKLGIHPGMGSSYLVKELFGLDRANYLLMLGEILTGQEAFRMGLCHDVVPFDDVTRRATELAINISESGPLALRLLKRNLSDYEALQAALRKEAEAQAENFLTKDFLESIKAIEEKRKAVFLDRY
ncbi:MAG: enoyl-CoA hydratase/isomerase family protein [Leptospiraceae bacterium]|nr:enoyl-CoA hydratase/isomerase family protein [Leptospiraceae bacterium]